MSRMSDVELMIEEIEDSLGLDLENVRGNQEAYYNLYRMSLEGCSLKVLCNKALEYENVM